MSDPNPELESETKGWVMTFLWFMSNLHAIAYCALSLYVYYWMLCPSEFDSDPLLLGPFALAAAAVAIATAKTFQFKKVRTWLAGWVVALTALQILPMVTSLLYVHLLNSFFTLQIIFGVLISAAWQYLSTPENQRARSSD